MAGYTSPRGQSAGNLVYLLLDANVTAAYYLPRSIRSQKARDRIENLLDSVRSGGSDHFLYIPNFCIAETFSVFMKYAYGHWNRHVRSKKGADKRVDKRVYESLVWQFADDIHNGKFFYQYELSRYHILGIQLVAPVDHYFQITRGRKNHNPAGTLDHLIISMGIQLAHVHGQDNVAIVTADDRLSRIVEKCKSGLSADTVKKLKLHIAREVLGRDFDADLFPECINLKHTTNTRLGTLLGAWPLPVPKKPTKSDVYRETRIP